MTYHPDDTIAAIATAHGAAPRCIVRISGPRALDALAKCLEFDSGVDLSALRQARVMRAKFRWRAAARPVPCQAYVWPGTRSYTRQPSAEIHTIGSPPLAQAVLAAALVAGARLAEPGEFTLRAFLGGRIDLAQAEAVLGVIDAQGPDELLAALDQLAGGLSGPLARLRETLLDMVAHLEAELDFADEEIDKLDRRQVAIEIESARAAVAELHGQMDSRERSSVLVRIVLVGLPNVGKSSLFNALARQSALVSDTPGTTRDYLIARLDLGVACEIVDTAGVEAAGGSTAIDQAAQQAARQQAAQTDIELFCLDATRQPSEWERSELARTGRRLAVLTKCDLANGEEFDRAIIRTSATTGAGLDELRGELARLASDRRPRRALATTAARSRDSLRRAGESLARAIELATEEQYQELLVVELRGALDELGSVAGAVSSEDVLNRIFSRFCIGK